ncbi:hypothetical protein BKK56_04030 [Rodentibacter genomosp. 2]|uniref:hypothetical protein n=1 Tax=Rodentibacter genomosp. 2 TaxID=1908266 RepID=UPI0009843283|nr:hypothetical protein BKK56_04030 [Rodentibacter genomosp. 2]
MKKMALVSVVFVSACSTSQVMKENASAVPQERLLAYQEYNPDYAKVIITRDSGFLGGGCYLGVRFRETDLARFDTSEMASFYIPEGDWNFAVTPDPKGQGLCSSAMGFNPAVETQHIAKDKKNEFRISSRIYRRPQLFPVKR